jgi:hypothetical protein
MRKSRQLKETPIQMEIDETKLDSQSTQANDERMDILVNALGPLCLQETADTSVETSDNLGAIPKRRHN